MSVTSETLPAHAGGPSIVDELLDLDALMSADVRLAERSVDLIQRADLEARIDQLHAELAGLVGSDGTPLKNPERSIGDRTAGIVNAELLAVQAEMEASKITVRLRQLNSLAWDEFYVKHRDTIDRGQPLSVTAQDELIAASIMTKQPATPDQIHQLRSKLGAPAMTLLMTVALDVNQGDVSGVSVPKSLLSSAVTRLLERDAS